MDKPETLTRLGESTWCIKGRTNIVFYAREDKTAYIVDSGRNHDDGIKVDEALDAMGWKLKGILCTHAHSDHCGAMHYLKDKYGCLVFCYGIECIILNNQEIESALMYGAHPHEILRKEEGFGMGSIECFDVTHELFPDEVKVLHLPGHSMNQIGYEFPDGTICLADAITGESVLRKYPFTYNHNFGQYLETLKSLRSLDGKWYVPSHGEIYEDITALIDETIESTYRMADLVLSFLDEPKNIEEIIKCLFDEFGMTMGYINYGINIYVLRAFISWLKDDGKIEAVFDDNMLRWRRN